MPATPPPLVNTLYGDGPEDAWTSAVQVIAERLRRPRKGGQLLEEFAASGEGDQRRRSHRLVMATLRHWPALEAALRRLVPRSPEPDLRALLLVAAAELVETEAERHPQVVHHAVAQAKKAWGLSESRLVNAVLRRLPEALRTEPDPFVRRGHPAWLAQRWSAAFGPAATEALLDWNQQASPLYVRHPGGAPVDTGWEPTAWTDFYRRTGPGLGRIIEVLDAGQAYIQDPSTRRPVALLAPRPGERVLDLCAAPGGKSRQILEAIESTPDSLLVALDLPGDRLERLRVNLIHARPPACQVRVVGADARTPEAALTAAGLPVRYDAVLLDAPCSNTGVIRRRPDVKTRLTPADFSALAALQKTLLAAAARLTAPGGRLVYSTCSIEPEENERRIEAFLRQHPHFRREAGETALPWLAGHDGGGAFLLTHQAPEK